MRLFHPARSFCRCVVHTALLSVSLQIHFWPCYATREKHFRSYLIASCGYLRFKEVFMWLLLALVLVLLWAGGFFVFHVSGFLIHLLIIFAVISLIVHFIAGRRS